MWRAAEPEKRYFPSPERQQKIEGHIYEGADRHCPACNAPMGAKASHCTQCGSPLDGGKEVRGLVEPQPVKKKRRRIWPFIVAGVLVVGFAIWFFAIRKREETMTVTGHRWARKIAIEEFREVSESAWRDQVPADASPPMCVRRERSTKQIPDGETCHTERVDKKDGTFEQVKKCKPKYRSAPVDDDWCTYTVRRWQKIDELKTAGTGTSPAWPDAPAATSTKRPGARSETLTLDFGGQRCEVADAVWRKHADGARVKLEVRASTGTIDCDSL